MSLEGPWAPAEAGPRVRVVLLNFKGDVRHSWKANIVRSDDTMIVLKAVATRMLRFDEMTIDSGDVVVQYFPRSEWFYIQKYLTPAGRLKGWYCNIAAPPLVEGSKITVKDLIVDVFVWPNRTSKCWIWRNWRSGRASCSPRSFKRCKGLQRSSSVWSIGESRLLMDMGDSRFSCL